MSDDPGFFHHSNPVGVLQNNVNRQIVSTVAGLLRVQTEYAFKIRTDFNITGDDFLRFWNRFSAADPDYKIFDAKILACSYFSRNPSSSARYPFHPSDLAFFGRTADVMRLFDVPLMAEGEAYWDMQAPCFNRYVPEQHIFINCLRKGGKAVLCDRYDDNSDHNILETEKYFASNFVFLTFEQFSLEPTKPAFRMKPYSNSFRTCYTHNEWLGLYKKHVDPTVYLPVRDVEREKIERFYKSYKKYRVLGNIMAFPFRHKDKKRKIRNNVLAFFLND